MNKLIAIAIASVFATSVYAGGNTGPSNNNGPTFGGGGDTTATSEASNFNVNANVNSVNFSKGSVQGGNAEQSQKQFQGQGQEQSASSVSEGSSATSSSTSGASNASTGAVSNTAGGASSNTGASNSSGTNTTRVTYNSRVSGSDMSRSVGLAVAPQLTTTLTETCMGSTSAAAGWSGASISFGTTWSDTSCVRRLDARQVQALGNIPVSMEMMCESQRVRDAAKRAGRPCVEDGGVPYGVAAVVPAAVVQEQPTDESGAVVRETRE